MPNRVNLSHARKFLQEVQTFLRTDRPQLVLDLSQVRQLDSAGVDVLLECVREASKRDGDVKLAAVSPEAAVVLELTRAARLFEIYPNSTDAARSFTSFLPNFVRAQMGYAGRPLADQLADAATPVVDAPIAA